MARVQLRQIAHARSGDLSRRHHMPLHPQAQPFQTAGGDLGMGCAIARRVVRRLAHHPSQKRLLRITLRQQKFADLCRRAREGPLVHALAKAGSNCSMNRKNTCAASKASCSVMASSG